MRKRSGWIALAVALLGTPGVGGAATNGRDRAAEEAKATQERFVDLDELRAQFFERLGELLAGWAEARGTVEPEDPTLDSPDMGTASSCGDGARGTVEPPGCI